MSPCLSAQQPPGVSANRNIQRIHYESPNEQQVKIELSSTEATQPTNSGSGARALLRGVVIKQFPVTGGDPQMVAETPECIFDNRLQQVNSADHLQVRGQQGRFFVEGNGFLFQITSSTLDISNNVHSVLELQTVTNAAATAGTEISSHRCEFQMRSDASNGVAIYQGTVRVNDPKIRLACEFLIADLPKDSAGQSNRVNHVVATTNVVLDFVSTNGEPIHATGQRAVYDLKQTGNTTNEILELTGQPRVDLTNGWMTADIFMMDRATGKLRGRDNYHFHSLAQNTTNDSSRGSVATNAPSYTDIYSRFFEFDVNTRLANFWGNVRATNAGMKLVCQALTATLPKSEPGQAGHLDHVVAETNVVIDFLDEKSAEKIHATGQKSVYDFKVVNAITNETLELTGNPAVEFSSAETVKPAKPSGWMTAEIIVYDRAGGKISGAGNDHSVLRRQPGEPATMDTEIFSDQFLYTMETGVAHYAGNVRAYDPELNLTSKTLTIKLARDNNTNRLERIFAEGGVTVDFADKPFAGADITNLTLFATRLKQPPDAISQFVSAQLAAPTQRQLSNYSSGPDPVLQASLAQDLSRLAQSGAVYESNRFDKVYLSLETTRRLAQQPLGIDLVELNRLLLLDAFRGEIRRNDKAEEIHGTGEMASYSSLVNGGVTNVVLELSGHPRMDEPNRWMTAEQSIILDRTTGLFRLVGDNRTYLKLEGMTENKFPGAKKSAPK